jgi:hypothetical protein
MSKSSQQRKIETNTNIDSGERPNHAPPSYVSNNSSSQNLTSLPHAASESISPFSGKKASQPPVYIKATQLLGVHFKLSLHFMSPEETEAGKDEVILFIEGKKENKSLDS